LVMFVTAKRRKSGPKTRAVCNNNNNNNNNIDKKCYKKGRFIIYPHTKLLHTDKHRLNSFTFL